MAKTFRRKNINGRNFQILTLPGSNLFKFELINMIGANIERVVEKVQGKNVYGLSHLIEHLGFRATKDYTTEELMKLLKTEGTYNASTDHDRINYWFKTTSGNADIATRLVCNYALNDLTKISQEEFDIEKKVVYNEAKRYADDDQTMFYFNTTPALCGYHAEDNVIGIPATVDTFTLADAIELKKLFLQHGRMVVNVLFDPEVLDEESTLQMISEELDRFETPVDLMSESAFPIEMIDEMLGTPVTENVLVENESEQAMTALCLDVIEDDIVVARLANAFLGRYSDTSLTDLIREQNGLTYGINLYDDNIAFKPHTFFMCDVSRGDEDKLMELFRQSINESVDNFTPEVYDELMKTSKLKRVMRFVNLESYGSLFWTAVWFPEVIDKYEAEFAQSIDRVFDLFDENECTYDNIKAYLIRVQEAVNDDNFGRVSNV